MPKKYIAMIALVLLIASSYWWVHRQVSTDDTPPPSRTSQNQKQSTSTNPKTTFDKHKYSIDDPASIWIVVNKARPLSTIAYAPSDVASIGNGQTMRTEAAQAFMVLVNDAKAAGYNVIAESGYRSYATQSSVYTSEVKAFGQAKADTESARPGHSEHQTGWAVDIGSPGCMEDCFGKTPAAKWLLDNAYKYGFVLRYPNDKSDITGYRNEPWHFRYVGKDLAQEMHSTAVMTLEEFFSLPAAPNY